MARKPSVGNSRKSTKVQDVDLILRMMEGIHHRGERLESLDEQRVRLFLTLVSGSLALLAIAVQFGRLGVSDWPLASSVLFVLLLAYGFETLHSLNWSRISIRENQAVEGFLFRRLASVNDVAAGIAGIQEKARVYIKATDRFRKTVRGNLVEFMYLTNGLLASGLFISLSAYFDLPYYHLSVWPKFGIAAVLFALLLYGQYRYSHWIREVIPEQWVGHSGEGSAKG